MALASLVAVSTVVHSAGSLYLGLIVGDEVLGNPVDHRFTTFVIRSCHSRSASVISTLAAGQAYHGGSVSCACHCDGEVLDEGIEVVCHIPVPVDEVEYLIKQDENRRLCYGEEASENPGTRGCGPGVGAQGGYALFARYLTGHVNPGSFGPVAGIPGVANEGCDFHFVRNCRSGLLEQVLMCMSRSSLLFAASIRSATQVLLATLGEPRRTTSKNGLMNSTPMSNPGCGASGFK